jgi:hypothetical protein
MKKVMCLALAALAGCASSEVLPVVDSEGALVGTYDPAEGALELGVDGASVATPTGEQVPLEAGLALLAEDLTEGDVLGLLDASGEELEHLVVGQADLDQKLGEDDAGSRHPNCRVDL